MGEVKEPNWSQVLESGDVAPVEILIDDIRCPHCRQDVRLHARDPAFAEGDDPFYKYTYVLCNGNRAMPLDLISSIISVSKTVQIFPDRSKNVAQDALF